MIGRMRGVADGVVRGLVRRTVGKWDYGSENGFGPDWRVVRRSREFPSCSYGTNYLAVGRIKSCSVAQRNPPPCTLA